MPDESGSAIQTHGTQVVVRGEFDLATAPELQRALDRLAGAVSVDCRHLDFIDSTGLAVLVRAHQRLAGHDGDLLIEGLSERCRRVFEVSGLDQALNLS